MIDRDFEDQSEEDPSRGFIVVHRVKYARYCQGAMVDPDIWLTALPQGSVLGMVERRQLLNALQSVPYFSEANKVIFAKLKSLSSEHMERYGERWLRFAGEL